MSKPNFFLYIRTAGDLNSLQQISQQMEILQNKHQQLLIEREDHHRIIRYGI
jgi:hypothetical protein